MMADDATMNAQNPRKRKRAAVACTTCHSRKVRCNVAFQGVPCSNCAQDGTSCKVYGQQPVARPGQPIRPREPSRDGTAYPLTPSPNATELSRHASDGALVIRENGKATAPSPRSSISSDLRRQQSLAAEQSPEVLANARRERSPDPDPKPTLVPYYSGESSGLELVFEIASPNRPVKGGPYIIARNVHRREWSKPEADKPRPLPPPAVCQKLICCFFHYVYPSMPVVDAGDFLGKYVQGTEHVSPILLWSVLFAAASYLDMASVKEASFTTRKSLKEYCYQNAKALYDTQREPDKTNVISSCLLLAFWYVDLQDMDGSWSWVGIASGLAQGIGLHREPKYAQIPKCPFPPSLQALWRRLWWCCYYRDAWLAIGFGRPMRLHLDDSDVSLPRPEELIAEIRDIPLDIRRQYIPADIEALAGLWVKMLQLSVKLEDILHLHYRPRRPPLSLSQMEKDDTEIWQLLDSIPREAEYRSTTLTLHDCHLRCYFNVVVITLYRSYILTQPDYLTPVEQEHLKNQALQRSKHAAASLTSIINRLLSVDLIELTPTILVTAMTGAMEIHLLEYAQSESITRQHAYHNLNLHMMVLSHLKKTYWSADMMHNLFTECLKAMDKTKAGKPTAIEAAPPEENAIVRAVEEDREPACTFTAGMDPTMGGNFLDDYWFSFNPFYNMQPMYEQSPVGWTTANHLNHDFT